MEKIRIEKNVPIPNITKWGVSKYPFAEMEIEDSFAVAITDNNYAEKIRQQLYSASRNYVIRNNNKWKFTTKILNTEVRIWRIK